MQTLFRAALLLALLSSVANAAQVDFSAVLTDADEVPITDCAGSDCAGKPELTLGRLAMRVLTASFKDEESMAGEEKFKRGQLAMRVYKGGSVALSAEDVATIKKLIAKGYGPLIVMKAWQMLDPSGR